MEFEVYVGDSTVPLDSTRSYRKALATAFIAAGWGPDQSGSWEVESNGGTTIIRGGEMEVRLGRKGSVTFKSRIPGRPTLNGWRSIRAARYVPPAPKAPAPRASDEASIVFTDAEGSVLGEVQRVRLRVGDVVSQLPTKLKAPENAVFAYAYLSLHLAAVREIHAPVARL